MVQHRANTSATASTAFSLRQAPTQQRQNRPSYLKLDRVINTGSPGGKKVFPSIIAIPGYQTPNVSEWDAQDELDEAARPIQLIADLHMYTYQPTYNEINDFSWESFLRTGHDLAEELAQLAAKYPTRPIIFIAHSLGGAFLKKALLLAHQNLQDQRFRLVVECLSGILFLGTPHAGASDEDTLLYHNRVLYSCAELAVQKHPSRPSRHDVRQLADLAATFEGIANVPILSVYEELEPRTGMQQLFTRKTKALVDQDVASISSSAERQLGVHLTHRELCKLPLLKNQSYSAQAFLRGLFQDLADRSTIVMSGSNSSSVGLGSTMPKDPLNPLNLKPFNRSASGNLPSSVPRRHTQEDSRSLHSNRISQRQLPLRLHNISNNTSRDRLLDNRTACPRCFSVPQQRNPQFTGRSDILGQIDEQLLPDQSAPGGGDAPDTRLFAICGMGGVGKTDLAIQYAFLRRDKFAAIFWIEAGGVSQLASDFAGIPTSLGLENRADARDLDSSIEIAKAWLASPRRCLTDDDQDEIRDLRPYLLIFDNADNLDILTEYVPFEGQGSILVTSRDPFAKEHFFSDGDGIDLEPLSTDESIDLLHKLVTPGRRREPLTPDEQEASKTLVKQVDGLPLAISQTAGFIRRRHLTIAEFVSMYRSDERYREFHDVGSHALAYRYGNTLATTFLLEEFGPEATKLLQLVAFMNPDRIQEKIFLQSAKSSDSVEGVIWNTSSFDKARYELISSSIIRRNIGLKELWIHRVIQTEVRTRMEPARKHQIFNDVVSLLAEIWPPGNLLSQQSARWTVCEGLLPHIEHLHRLFVEYSDDWKGYPIRPALPSLLNEAALYLHERGLSHEGKVYLELALDLCRRANITTEPLISDMHLTMGALSNETNDAQSCLEHNVCCLSIRKDLAAKNNQADLRLAFAYSQMGIAYMMVKRFAQATEYFKQSVELLKVVQAPGDEYGFPVCNLGLAYWVQEQLDDADKTLTDLLNQREQLHGKLDKVSYKTGRVLQGLGNVRGDKAKQLEKQGDQKGADKLWVEAFEMHKNCLAQYESTLGKFNHRTADACHKVAEHYIRLKEDEKAQDYLDRALSIWGERHWFRNESARTSFLRGTHLRSMGGAANEAAGDKWIERAKLLRKEILPDEEPRELDTLDFDDIVCFWSI